MGGCVLNESIKQGKDYVIAREREETGVKDRKT